MFRTLFFLRLECGQECVVVLLALRGRKTYHAIMLEEREERGEERQERESEAEVVNSSQCGCVFSLPYSVSGFH